jgi:hypothetical protein
MTRNRWILVAVAVLLVVLAAVWYYSRRGGEAPAVIDLVQRFPEALKQPVGAGADVFAVRDEQIGGETRRAIYAHPPTRITWKVVVPNDAWLRTSLGVGEQAWDTSGNGVLFFIGISEGGHYDLLLTQYVDPHNTRGDRRWVPVTIDLSPYGGRAVEIIFNTRTSPAGVADDPRNDFAYWGAPAICLRP